MSLRGQDVRILLLLLGGFGLYAASAVTWLMCLRVLPLTQAYAVVALAFAIVPLLAHFFLGDPLSWKLLLGTPLIIAGVLIIAQA